MNTKEYARQYRQKNREKLREYQRNYFAKIREKRALQLHMGYLRNREEKLQKAKERGWLAKFKVLEYYGGGKCACVRCSYDDIRALTIDHINGGGQKQRKESRVIPSGTHFYSYLIKQNYPKGFQTLCTNCQRIKQFENKEWRQSGVRGD